jgi:hypothetical protein
MNLFRDLLSQTLSLLTFQDRCPPTAGVAYRR